MTDKSFGDHTNRNIPKNPLLSTAVTGLCLEDLTHNAVLLPVFSSQEVITRPDQQIGSQTVTLGYTDHAVSSLQSGDTNPNPSPFPLPPTTPTNILNPTQSTKTNPDADKPRSTQSKALPKSDDDFDVNEYFARLHGSRYVSAPLNSILKEDKNADLETAEENLEEINLNEPEKVVEQQSLTTDIAQNFSQLPTMLPQVASAVFSSFSNMLQTRKSREVTPEGRNLGYQEVQLEKLPEPTSEYLPPVAPPKDPPIMPPTAGTANYRLPSKKKYAQIPGLSSRDTAQIPLQPSNSNFPPVSQSVPQYFVPSDAHMSQNTTQMSQNVPQMGQNVSTTSQDIPHLVENAPQTQKVSQINQNMPHYLSQNIALTIHETQISEIPPNISQYIPPMRQTPAQHSSSTSTSLPMNNTEPQKSEIPQNISQYIPPMRQNPAQQLFSQPNLSMSFNSPTVSISQTLESQQGPPYFLPQEVKTDVNKDIDNPEATDQTTYKIGLQSENQSQKDSGQKSSDDLITTNDNPKDENVPTYFIPKSSNEGASIEEQQLINTYASNIPIAKEDEANQTLKMDTHVRNYSPNPTHVLPPPPKFANVKPDQFSGGRNVLPPSVARRISSNHPVIKHSPIATSFPENIFIPAPLTQASDLNTSSGQAPFASLPISASSNVPANAPSQSCASNFTFGLENPSFITNASQTFPSATEKREASYEIKPPPTIFTPSEAKPEVSASTQPVKSLPGPPLSFSTTSVSTSAAEPLIPQPEIAPPTFFTPAPSSSHVPTNFSSLSQSFSWALPTTSNVPSAIFATKPSQPPAASIFPPKATFNEPPKATFNEPPKATFIEPPKATFNEPPKATFNEPPQATFNDPPKATEPPRASSNMNFRMAKKRPQYYAGPIEGVGAISNNVKPIMPPVNTGLFHGALFTPQVEAAVENASVAPFDINPPVINTANAPYDINRSTFDTFPAQLDSNRPAGATPFDISRQDTALSYQVQNNPYNTAFDVSRPTENYEPKQDSSFGLFGSLKSKLSSLDINKIQNSVTTFFDPAYNAVKTDDNNAQNSGSYGQQQYTPGQMQSSNLEIFVPNVEQSTEACNQNFNYQTAPSQYGYEQQNQGQEAYNYFQNTGQNVPNYFEEVTKNYQAPADLNKQEIYSETGPVHTQLKQDNSKQDDQSIPVGLGAIRKHASVLTPNKMEEKGQQSYTAIPLHQTTQETEKVTDTNQYGGQNVSQSAELTSSLFPQHTLDLGNEGNILENKTEGAPKGNSVIGQIITNMSTQNFFDSPPKTIGSFGMEKTTQDFKPQSTAATKSFFDNSQLIAPQKNAQIEESDAQKYNISQFSSQWNTKEQDFSNTVTSFFYRPPTKAIKTQDMSGNIDLMTSEIVKDVISSVIETNVDPIVCNDIEIQRVSLTESNPLDFFGSFAKEPNTPSIFSNFVLDKNDTVEKSMEKNKDQDDYIRYAPELSVSSAPLFGLSSMLADKTRELNDLEDEIRRMSLQEPIKDIENVFSRSNNDSFFENPDVTEENVEVKSEGSDLNICETCREVKRPDDQYGIEDLTSQLIENITSPIQLLNPVEVPLPEHINPSDERTDFDSNQCAEISHITEETIETIQVQSATELLDDEQIKCTRSYGWTEEPITTSSEQNYSVPYQSKLEQDFNLPINPSVIGFFGGERGLFEKMSIHKDLDPDLKFDTPIVLSRQISMPSAPPEEDDQKSEGIDVHSIEQDAKKDFPIFEEFFADKDFKQSSESLELDSFTSRVDKYKKKEEIETLDKRSPTFDLNATISPSIPIASYFDTGNYAAETHYRNSLSSPSQICVPPGFEDPFQRRSSTLETGDKNDFYPPLIPDTSTQTKLTNSPTFSTAHNVPVTTTVDSPRITGSRLETSESVTLPDFRSVIRKDLVTDAKQTVDKPHASVAQVIEGIQQNFELAGQSEEPFEANKEKLYIKSDLETKEEDVVSQIFGKPIQESQKAQKSLPDPINFFSSSDETQKTSSDDQGFTRLASYFASPAKTEQTKSFFELSQSQNHYRNIPKTDPNPVNKTPFPQSQTHNIPLNKMNIPPDQYLANLNLMSDLTSIQNAEFKPENVVKTVNYFTVEYDNETLVNEFNKGEPDSKKEQTKPNKAPEVSEKLDDRAAKNVIRKCKHCCDFDVGPVNNIVNVQHELLTDFKVRKCMDGNKETKKEVNMEPQKEVDNTNSISVNFDGTVPDENEAVCVTTLENRPASEYTPVRHHWFYRIDIEGKSTWRGFSVVDSRALEEAFNSPDLTEDTLVPTDGGRFDVNIMGRLRFPVYWTEKPANVRRCSWFYKGNTELRYVPYTEAVAEKLEEEYRHGMTTGEWHRRLVLPNNEVVVMHQPHVMVHFVQSGANDAYSSPPLFAIGKRVYRNPPKIRVSRDQPKRIDHLVMMVHGAGEYSKQKEKIQSTTRPCTVRRGCDESEIEEVEPSSIDHLLLLCHGVGSSCDMRFRSVEEVVNDLRTTSLQLIQSHYKTSYDSGIVGRVEVLPISWHATLHSGETGVDERLGQITLESIPRLRTFTNDTVLDVLFYTSPVYCQTIINTVCSELNRIYKLFRERNPKFQGSVSLGGHSLGSVILYDLLCHQKPASATPAPEKVYVSGAAGTGQPSVRYPALHFQPTALYALGSPIAIFECIRGVERLSPEFSLPTCKNFFNIFHPYDPIAYRIEPLINPELRALKPFLIPHHKGRKRMHLELKETMTRVGADIKQKLLESIKSTWSNMWKSHPTDKHLEKVVEEEIEKEHLTEESKDESKNEEQAEWVMPGSVTPGLLNAGRRVDYVLQEAPFEMINEYLFAMSSHVCYWESEDTMLLMLREIYDALGVQPDSTVPQNSLTVQRTRIVQPDESISALTANLSDNPSTSRGAAT